MRITYKHTMAACSLSYVIQSVVINLAPLFYTVMQHKYGVSIGELATLVLVMFLCQLLVDIISVKAVAKIGYRAAALISCSLSAIGLVLMGILPNVMPHPFAGFLISIIIASIGGGIIEVIISPIVESLTVTAKAAQMSLLHSSYSWGHVFVVIFTTISLSIIGHDNWHLITYFWALLPALNFIFFLFVPLVPVEESSEGSRPLQLLRNKTFILFAIVMLCGGAAEQIMGQWASLFAETALGVNKVWGDLLGACLFAFFMGAGRTLFGIAGRKINIRKALVASSVIAILCYVLASAARVPLISLAGCALCGAGVCLMWPGTLSMTAERCRGGTAMFGMLAFFGDVGCSLGPWFTGIVSDGMMNSGFSASAASSLSMTVEELSLKTGILAGTLFPAIMLVALLLLGKRKT